MLMAKMLRRGGFGKLRAFAGNFDSVSSILQRYAANFSSPSPSPSSSSSPFACGPDADVLVTNDLLLDTAKVELEPALLRPRVVVYDGVCHLCHRGVKWLIEADKDKKIKFCCLQSKAAEPYLSVAGVDRGDVLRRFLFVEGPGLYHQGSAAALRVASYLPFPYNTLSSLMIIPPPLRDAVYDYIAKHRYEWFGKSSNCLVRKEKELLERFVDWEEHIDKNQSELSLSRSDVSALDSLPQSSGLASFSGGHESTQDGNVQSVPEARGRPSSGSQLNDLETENDTNAGSEVYDHDNDYPDQTMRQDVSPSEARLLLPRSSVAEIKQCDTYTKGEARISMLDAQSVPEARDRPSSGLQLNDLETANDTNARSEIHDNADPGGENNSDVNPSENSLLHVNVVVGGIAGTALFGMIVAKSADLD